MRRYLIPLLFAVVGLTACSPPPVPTDGLVVGQAMPDVLLVGLEGGSARLSDYRGKLVVLNLWATWCEPCRREMPNLQQLSDALDPQRFAVVGLAADEDAHLVREYLLDKQVTFPNYIDTAQQVSREQFGVQLFPYTLLISPDGHFIQRFAGPREWHRSDVIALLGRAYEGDYSGLQ